LHERNVHACELRESACECECEYECEYAYKEDFLLRVVCISSFPFHATSCIIIISINILPVLPVLPVLRFLPVLPFSAPLVQSHSPLSSAHLVESACPCLARHSASQRLAVPLRHSSRRRLLVPVWHSSRRRLLIIVRCSSHRRLLVLVRCSSRRRCSSLSGVWSAPPFCPRTPVGVMDFLSRLPVVATLRAACRLAHSLSSPAACPTLHMTYCLSARSADHSSVYSFPPHAGSLPDTSPDVLLFGSLGRSLVGVLTPPTRQRPTRRTARRPADPLRSPAACPTPHMTYCFSARSR